MKMGFFYTAVMGNFTSAKIRKVSGGDYSHVGVYYQQPAGDVYFESHWGKWDNGDTIKTGVRGPLRLEDLYEWKLESPNHVLYIQDALPTTKVESEESYERMLRAVKTIKYAHVQLFWNYISAKTGFNWYWRRGGRRRMTCCEAVLVKACPAKLWPYFGFPYIIADDTFPSGVNGVYRGAKHILERE